MTWIDFNDYLKAAIFNDQEAWLRLPRGARREARKIQHARRGREVRRTDFGRRFANVPRGT